MMNYHSTFLGSAKIYYILKCQFLKKIKVFFLLNFLKLLLIEVEICLFGAIYVLDIAVL